MTAPETLEAIVARTAGEPVAPEIGALAEAMRARHEPGAVAVIAYGSSLRGIGLTDTLIDLYVLTDTGEAVSRNRLARLGCRLVPPNVHYGEARHGAVALRAKYAVLPLDQFARRMGQGVATPISGRALPSHAASSGCVTKTFAASWWRRWRRRCAR
jgi:hypothetical protein